MTGNDRDRAASVKAGEVVAVRPLRWNRTTLWGEFKWRAICPAFGHEYACFMQGDLTLPEQQERKDKIQAEYERGIRSALVVEPAPTASVGAMRPWPKALNVTRAGYNSWHGDISFAERPTDDELAALHDFLRANHKHRPALAAANQSDGGAKAGSSPILANKEEQRAGAHGVTPVGNYADATGCTDVGPSDTPPAPKACARCQGNGEIVTDWSRYTHPSPGDTGEEALAECPDCDGTGRVDASQAVEVVSATPPAPTPSAERERVLALVDELLQADTEFENAYPGESKAALEALDSARARLEAALTALLPDAAATDDPLDDLVRRFSVALLEKLKAAREKYGYGDEGWRDNDWQDECQIKLISHLAKGDPRDVAAYCAFMWHHGWSTVAPDPLHITRTQTLVRTRPDAAAIRAAAFEEAAKQCEDIYSWRGAAKRGPMCKSTLEACAAAIRAAGEK